jgi:hypothetical protein
MSQQTEVTLHIKDISKLLSKIDPTGIQKLFPSKADQKKFERAQGIVLRVLESRKHGPMSAPALEQAELAAGEFRELYKRLSPRTELASKAALNEAVLWAELGYLEQSISLAGIAKKRHFREPYRSQLRSLPTHACCLRFRQLTKLSESVGSMDRIVFEERRQSYLAQFVYFAGQAYLENREHPMVAYLQMLACLTKAYELELQGLTDEASALAAIGYEAIHAIAEPSENSHYMELQYHIMNASEFAEFPWLVARHPEVHRRLMHLSARASRLRKEGRGKSPAIAFAIAPLLEWGARSAPVVGVISIVLLIASLLGWNQATIRASISVLLHAGDLVAYTGGIAAQLAALASHTGGFA